MGQIIRQGARVWLETVLNTAQSSKADGGHTVDGHSFPVETGEAAASLLPLAEYLGVSIGISPDPKAQNLIGQGIGEGQQFQLIDNNLGTWRYSFAWSTEVYHFFLNDLFPMRTVIQSPWQSIETADRAMYEYCRDEIKRRLPKFSSYIYSVEGARSIG